MMDAHNRGLRLRLQNSANDTYIAYVDDPRLHRYDDIGALYYVVAVVLIYGLSIVMMIASHIRKNQQDSQLRTYLKEMAILRKNDRREKIIGVIAKPPPPPPPPRIATLVRMEDVPIFEEKNSCSMSNATSHITEEDEVSELLLPSDSDSVFHMPNDNTSESDQLTPKLIPPPQLPQQPPQSNVKIQIIDENGRL